MSQNPVIGVVDIQMKPSQTFEFAVHKGITLYTVGKVPANLRVRVINASKADLLNLPEDHDECVTLATNIIVTGLGYAGSIQLNPIDTEAFLPRGMGANARKTLTLVFEALDSPESGVIRIKKKYLSAYLSHARQITLTGKSPAAEVQMISSPAPFLGLPVNPPNPDCYIVQLADNAPTDGSSGYTLVAFAKPESCEEAAISPSRSLQRDLESQVPAGRGSGAD